MSRASHMTRKAELIEKQVLARNAQEVFREIPAFLRAYGSDHPDVLFMACDWLRRLGAYERALRLLKIEELKAIPRSPAAPSSSHQSTRRIWAARLLNLMGASEFARQILAQVEPRSFDEHRFVGSIQLSNYEFARAAKTLERMRELDPDPNRYISRLARLMLADARSGMRQYDEALQIARQVADASEEPLLKGIAWTAVGEYLCNDGKFKRARMILGKSRGYYPVGDASPDFAIYNKWLAYAEAMTGSPREARQRFKLAHRLIVGSSLRPEAWMDLMRIQDRAGLLPAATLDRVCNYPGLAQGFREYLPAHENPRCDKRLAGAQWGIDLDANEYWEERAPMLGIPVEVRALAVLSQASPWGMPAVRFKSLLWPGEAHAFLQLEGRLQMLLRRMRTRLKIDARLQGRRIRLSPADARSVVVVRRQEYSQASDGLWVSSPSFLEGRTGFSRTDMQAYYDLSQSQAQVWLGHWIQRGWVRAVGSGPRRRYQV